MPQVGGSLDSMEACPWEGFLEWAASSGLSPSLALSADSCSTNYIISIGEKGTCPLPCALGRLLHIPWISPRSGLCGQGLHKRLLSLFTKAPQQVRMNSSKEALAVVLSPQTFTNHHKPPRSQNGSCIPTDMELYANICQTS